MSVDEGLFAWVEEALEPIGRVTLRKMMGAAVLYCDGIVFAVMDDGELWLKSDAETDAAWDAEGCERFAIALKDGSVEHVNYRRAPDAVYDEPEAMQRWASLALEAGLRGAAKKKKKPKRSV